MKEEEKKDDCLNLITELISLDAHQKAVFIYNTDDDRQTEIDNVAYDVNLDAVILEYHKSDEHPGQSHSYQVLRPAGIQTIAADSSIYTSAEDLPLDQFAQASVLPMQIAEYKTDSQELTEVIICDAIAGGRRYRDGMPKDLRLVRRLANGDIFRGTYPLSGHVIFEPGPAPAENWPPAPVPTDETGEAGPSAIEIAARNFLWNPENWEGYEDCKSSNSAAIPPDFMRLGEMVEERFGPPPTEDE